VVGSKDHTDISPDNILKLAIASLTVDRASSEGEFLVTIPGGS
jgi:hypothetical protein